MVGVDQDDVVALGGRQGGVQLGDQGVRGFGLGAVGDLEAVVVARRAAVHQAVVGVEMRGIDILEFEAGGGGAYLQVAAQAELAGEAVDDVVFFHVYCTRLSGHWFGLCSAPEARVKVAGRALRGLR